VIEAQEARTREALLAKAETVFGEPKNATRLVQDGRVWVDGKRGLVIVDGYVTLRKGQLEMFACPTGTKEHESIIAVFSAARHIHAGLLAAGAEPGAPTRFEPYRPASGTTIKASILYRDAEGKSHVDTAQSWVRNLQTKKEMPYDWVFAGSAFYKDIDTGEDRYLGDAGDLMCVANFPSATMDLAVESAAANSGLNYEAFTENIPPDFTLVRLVLKVSDEEPRRSSDLEPGVLEPGIAVPAATVDSTKVPPIKTKETAVETPKVETATNPSAPKTATPKSPSKPKNPADEDFNVDELFESFAPLKAAKK